MIAFAPLLRALQDAAPAYDPTRLYATLAFMFVVVGAAVAFVRIRYPGRLIADIALTLGVFLLVIGTIVYTVAFRGLQPIEMVVAWVLSFGAIAWFVAKLNEIMSRPLSLLEQLAAAVRRGDWALLLRGEDGAAGREIGAALREVGSLIGETKKTAGQVLGASSDVARIGANVADGAGRVTHSLSGVAGGVARSMDAARQIRQAAAQLDEAAGATHVSARESREISAKVEASAQVGVTRAGDAMAAVTEVAELARDLVERMESLRTASGAISDVTTVVGGIGRQTNLLALNASIEAARAGEAGRGFAVVAEEVGKLAMQSGGSVGRIEMLVREMTERIEDASDRVRRMEVAVKRGEQVMHDALGVFHSIEQDARRTLSLAEAVLRASERQDSLVRQVNDASTLVAEAADASSAATEEAARAMQHQRSLTEQLRETAHGLERSAGSLSDVVSRFGAGRRRRRRRRGMTRPREGQTFDGGSRFVRYVNFVKLPHTVFALPFALVGATLASFAHGVTFATIGWIVLAFTAARFAAMGFNRIVDRQIDAKNPRTARRELPSGLLGVREASVAVVLASMVFVLAAWQLNPLCAVLSPGALGWVLWYSYTKRFTHWSHIVLGLGLAIAPVGGYLAVAGTWSTPWWMLIALAVGVSSWTAGFDILYALQDEEFDRAEKLHSVPVMFGRRGALAFARTLHVVTIASLAAVGTAVPVGWLYAAGVCVAAALLLYEHSLVRGDDLSRLDAAFFTMNGVISLTFFGFVLAERLVG